MRYALRNQEKIAGAYGAEYLQKHLLASLDEFFRVTDEDALDDLWITPGDKFKILQINDLANEDAMLEFAIIDRKFDVLKLAFF